MLAWILEQARLDAGLPGRRRAAATSASRRGSAQRRRAPFVIEADEYDTAFFDKRSKFVHYRPRTAILNNLEFDHADIFDDLAAIERQFHHLVRTVPARGPARRQRARGEPAARARDGLLERGAALRRAQGRARARCARAASRMRSTCCAASLKIAPRRMAAARRAQPAERARRDRRGRARRRRARRRGARRWRSFENVQAPARAARRASPASRSTTTSRTTRPRSRTTIDGLRREGRRGAHPRRLRAALEHDEARRDEGAAAVGARGGRPVVLPRRRPGLGRRAGAGADGRAGRRRADDRRRWSPRSSRRRGPATTSCA